MKSRLISLMLVVASLLFLFVMALLGSSKGLHFTEAAGDGLAGVLVLAIGRLGSALICGP
jgi:hypothetical protein